MPAGFPQQQAPWAPFQFGPAPGVAWANIGVRIGALVLDAVLLFVGLIVAGVLVDAFGYKEYADRTSYYPPAAMATSVIYMIFLLAYFPTTWWAFQGTLGQRLLRLRVVRARDGAALGIGETTIRYLLWVICVVTVVPGIIAAAMAGDNPMRRTWWDDASGSIVVRRS